MAWTGRGTGLYWGGRGGCTGLYKGTGLYRGAGLYKGNGVSGRGSGLYSGTGL